MKRFAAGAVAVATALSLSTGVASAGTTKDIDTLVNIGAALGAGIKNGVSEPHDGSADASSESLKDEGSARAWVDFYGSSYKNDADNDYKLGTTADILWGVGIAAAVLAAGAAAVNAGVIPGVSLPF
ncbi:hypothetical protein NQ023_10350 [Corynebacterium phoceense]|uniref:hypothetical protein n=1 Tax=Corynebacterium phoceense TaxID=1686286 RepID=UPI00211C61EC|nr:hypothetical protein [Corynebacterium phoceense]MCQ9332042.1 hypothetical protein [Corynebacterium phoceense]MCQ9341126.1 hypothetical protein [Corynebacterium phoceense]MCQ9348863.1 hypothetical protein [Corynebacterium phoceense]